MARESGFVFHVDSSCITDSTDLKKPSKRSESDQTVIHNEPEDIQSENDESHSHDEHTEALIHAAARAVIASIEHDGYDQDDSVLSARTEEEYDADEEHVGGAGTELTYGDATELSYESDGGHSNHDPYDGSASSHHEDDVFSQGTRSNRSSRNSCTDEEALARQCDDKQGEHQRQIEQANEHDTPISRMPSAYSQDFALRPEPLAINSSPSPHTPAKVVSRPPFRTPSSVRAMQMSSPTPSIFSGSPRSSKRHTVSRLGTPQAHDSSPIKKTPMKFKAKQEHPLVLLHVTVLPLQWSYGDAMDASGGEGLPRELHSVRESWRLLQEKLGEMVLERGILLAHPQDSYEVLEERLLEALELPVRPRAKILSCGHYLGPDDTDDSASEDSENEDESNVMEKKGKWCDICTREVMYQELGLGGKQKRFRIKVYASNGLMRAGAWAAAWREMERVDVEIIPFVPSHLVAEMDSLTAFHARTESPPTFDHVESEEQHQTHEDHEHKYSEQGEAMRRRLMEEERMREIYGDNPPTPPSPEVHEVRSVPETSSRRQEYGDSLPELLLAALKVVLRDQKQVAICVLSILVLILALRPAGVHNGTAREDLMPTASAITPGLATHTVEVGQEVVADASKAVAEIPAVVVAAVRAATDEAIAPASMEEAPLRPSPENPHETLKPVTQRCVLVDENLPSKEIPILKTVEMKMDERCPPNTAVPTIKTGETKMDERHPPNTDVPTIKTCETKMDESPPNTEEAMTIRNVEKKMTELEADHQEAMVKKDDVQEEKDQ